MSETPIYAITEWDGPQATPWTEHNEGVRMLEAVVRGSVIDRDENDPPGVCDDGACYLVAAVATGAWAGEEGKMAVAFGANASNGWRFLTVATEGQILWVEDENLRIQYTSGSWAAFPDVTSLFAVTVDASEAIAGGEFVNFWDDGGTAKVRLADATDPDKAADGYAPAGAGMGDPCQVLPLAGLNSAVSPAFTGPAWLSVTTPGDYQNSEPTGSGEIVQPIGKAVQGIGIYLRSADVIGPL